MTYVSRDHALGNISPDYTGASREEQAILRRILALEGTPRAAIYFSHKAHLLSDHLYWFLLGTLWVSYSGFIDLSLWRRLMSSPRPQRATSIMKPDELRTFEALPDSIPCWRAHRSDEREWIAYTLDRAVAERLAMTRGGPIRRYLVPKPWCLALFLRRGEAELIMLNQSLATPIDA